MAKKRKKREGPRIPYDFEATLLNVSEEDGEYVAHIHLELPSSRYHPYKKRVPFTESLGIFHPISKRTYEDAQKALERGPVPLRFRRGALVLKIDNHK